MLACSGRIRPRRCGQPSDGWASLNSWRSPLDGGKTWDITGTLDFEKALNEVRVEDAADPDRLLTYEQISGPQDVRVVFSAKPAPVAPAAVAGF
jgi:hypothetical protein